MSHGLSGDTASLAVASGPVSILAISLFPRWVTEEET